MAVQSGTSANVTLLDNDADTSATKVFEATGWTCDRSAVETSYCSNTTNGNRRTKAGTKDAKGTVTGVYDPSNKIETQLDVGSRVLLQLHVTDVLGHQLYATITGLSYGGDINEGTIPTWTANWAQDDDSPSFAGVLVDANP